MGLQDYETTRLQKTTESVKTNMSKSESEENWFHGLENALKEAEKFSSLNETPGETPDDSKQDQDHLESMRKSKIISEKHYQALMDSDPYVRKYRFFCIFVKGPPLTTIPSYFKHYVETRNKFTKIYGHGAVGARKYAENVSNEAYHSLYLYFKSFVHKLYC